MKKRRKQYKNGFLEKTIRSVAAGDIREFSLSDVNVKSFRAKASEINGKIGHKRYSITKNAPLGLMCIINND